MLTMGLPAETVDAVTEIPRVAAQTGECAAPNDLMAD